MTGEPWPAEWQRGLLPTAILGAISSEPLYGYRIAQRLEQLGWGTLAGGTLYPILRSLDSSGLVASRWQAEGPGPARRYYELTDQGRAVVARRRESWTLFAHSMSELLTRKGGN